MAYHLYRITDRAGDSGSMSNSLEWKDDGTLNKIDGNIPKIGNSMQVGTAFARSYSRQDWWMTTAVTEIIKDILIPEGHYMMFKTGNSIYEWWVGNINSIVKEIEKAKKNYINEMVKKSTE